MGDFEYFSHLSCHEAIFLNGVSKLCEEMDLMRLLHLASGEARKDRFLFCSLRPNLMHSSTFAGKAFVMPSAVYEFIIKLKACSYSGIVSREELDVLGVFAIYSIVSSTARSFEFFGGDIVGNPLESGA